MVFLWIAVPNVQDCLELPLTLKTHLVRQCADDVGRRLHERQFTDSAFGRLSNIKLTSPYI